MVSRPISICGLLHPEDDGAQREVSPEEIGQQLAHVTVTQS